MSDIYSDKPPFTASGSGPRRFAVLAGKPEASVGRNISAAALLQTIERLEQVIDLETAALKQSQPADLRDFNIKKSQGLLELNRMLRSVDPVTLAREAREPLGRLRDKLDRNLRMLQNHLRAVREVARVIAGAIQEAESDGTYCERPSRWEVPG